MEAIQLLSSQTGAAQKIQLLSAFLQPQNLDGQSVVFEEERERERAGGQFSLCFAVYILIFCFLHFYVFFCIFVILFLSNFWHYCVFLLYFCSSLYVFLILRCIFRILYLGSEER